MPMSPRPFSVIRPAAPMPADITRRQSLFALYALHEWEWAHLNRLEPYAPGFFYNKTQGCLKGLQNISRKSVLRHIQTGVCLVCQTPIDLTKTTLDHLMPRHEGGPESPNNVLMLCRRCNSSKGKKDLLAWWLYKEYKVIDLPRDVLCLYARIYWHHLGEERLSQGAPEPTRTFLHERLIILPSNAHKEALFGATYAGCAQARLL